MRHHTQPSALTSAARSRSIGLGVFGRTARTFAVLAAALFVLFGALASLAVPAQAADRAPGRVALSRTTAVAGSTATYTLTVSASASRIRGTMRLTIPGGWSVAQANQPTGPGYVKVSRGKCTTGKLDRIERFVGGARRLVLTLDCAKGTAAKIAYQRAAAPTIARSSRWQATAKFNSWGQFVPFSTQPTVNVAAAAPAKLTLLTSPTRATARTVMEPSTFEVRDQYGNLATKPVDVTVALTYCVGATLSGDATVSSAGGLATFTDLQVDKACAMGYLEATSPGLAGSHSYGIRVAGAWQTVATAPIPVTGAAITQLTDGRIFIAGVADRTSGTETADTTSYVYNPDTRTFDPIPDAPTARMGATAIQLPDGRVLVFGGRATYSTSDQVSRAVDVWDPATGQWDSLGDRTVAADGSYADKAALLSDGRVLVVSAGWGATPMLYDPATDAWTLTNPLHHPNRDGFSFAQFHDGRVLVFGGTTNADGFIGFPEIYDPVTGEWSEAAEPQRTRRDAAAVVLADGRVLMIGGYTNIGSSNPTQATSDAYDPATNTWQAGPALNLPRLGAQAVIRTDGTVMIAGGLVESQYAYPERRRFTESLSGGTWTSEKPLTEDRYNSRVYLFATDDNTVIALGGATVEQFS
jgi:hypothetical protein